MANRSFWLKYRDTKPDLIVYLKNPDGSAHDLTGSTGWKLHIRLDGISTVLTKVMAIEGSPELGALRYNWASADWNAGGLVQGTHRMEYEVVGPGAARLTFPNDGYDVLRIVDDLGQG